MKNSTIFYWNQLRDNVHLHCLARVACIIAAQRPRITSCGFFDRMKWDILRMKSSTAERKLRKLRELYLSDYANHGNGWFYDSASKTWDFDRRFIEWCEDYFLQKKKIFVDNKK